MAGDVPSKIATGKYVRQIIVSAPGPQGPLERGQYKMRIYQA